MATELKKILTSMIHELIENNREHKHGRVSWFDHHTRINKLTAIAQWLDAHDLDEQNEDIILSLLRHVCDMKDNPLALFPPHSSYELDDMIKKYKLNFSLIRFSYDELDEVLAAGGLDRLVNEKKSALAAERQIVPE